MSIKARRGLLLVTIMVVVVGALLLSVGASSPTEAQTATAPPPAPISGQVAVKATFLHADAADAPAPPTVVDLSAAGYKPGDTLKISYRVPPPGFSYYGCQGPFVGAEGVRLLGVFSSSSQLLAPSARRARVPGAIDAGDDAYVGPTYLNNAPVDIPQDFQVTPPSGLLIKIPPSATHLFLGIPDPYHGDNCGTGATFDIETVPDTTAPSLTVPSDTIVVEATGPDGAVVDFANDVSASEAVDPNPSINCTPASGTTLALGTTQVTCTATDAAGNESVAKTFDVKVQDTTAPVITPHGDVTEEATGPDGANVDYTSPATSDAVDGNGTADCSPASGSTFELGDTTVTCTAQDAAGNQATPSTFQMTVEDTTRPTDIQFVGNINDGDSFYFGNVPAEPTCTATDGGSGLQSCVVSGHSTDVGTHTLTATATDKAGNRAIKEITYTVKAWTFEGFYQPVDMGGVYNTVKGGSTVPFKFEIFEGTTELTDTAYSTSRCRLRRSAARPA